MNFEIVDRNRDGLLNRKEMRGLLTLLNEDPIIIPQMINDFFALFGKSEKDATCDFEHFYANYARMLMFRAIFELKNKAGWELEDCNKDGYISMDELETMLQKWYVRVHVYVCTYRYECDTLCVHADTGTTEAGKKNRDVNVYTHEHVQAHLHTRIHTCIHAGWA